jgi:hypothetical protein
MTRIQRAGWSRKFEKCQQCGTKRFKHKARGLCIRCYQLVKKLEQVTHWNLYDAKSLTDYPTDMMFHDPQTFQLVHSDVSNQIKERLEFLLRKERKLEGPVDGIDIERQLGRIAIKCRVKDKSMFHGRAGSIDDDFNTKQIKRLFELLNEIEEGIPWAGIDFFRDIQHNLIRRNLS